MIVSGHIALQKKARHCAWPLRLSRQTAANTALRRAWRGVVQDAWPQRVTLVWMVVLASKRPESTAIGWAWMLVVALAAHVLACAADGSCCGRGAWVSSLLLVACAPYVEALAGPCASGALALAAHAALVRHGQAVTRLAVTLVGAAGLLALGDDAWPLPLAAMALPCAFAPASRVGAASIIAAVVAGTARGGWGALFPSATAGLLGTLVVALLPGAVIVMAMRRAHVRRVRPFVWRAAMGHAAGRAWALACASTLVEALCCGVTASLMWAACLYGTLWLAEAATDPARAVSAR